jgi:formylglycine-generating enzyme required for sulfatase activity
MSPFHRKSLAGLFWIRMCVAHLRIPLVVIAALILAGVLAVHAEAADRAGKTFRDCEMCPEMVIIPPGKFIMGSPETEKDRDADEGQHTVVITYSFAVSKGPITWDLWDACVRDGVCDGPSVEAALRLDRNGKPIQDYVDHVRGNHFAGPLNGRRRHSVFGIKIPSNWAAIASIAPAAFLMQNDRKDY